jgi:ApaG protein
MLSAGRLRGASEIIVPAGAIVMESSTHSRSPYAATTRDITVTVQPYFLEEQSVPDAGHFVWAYHVRIQNGGEQTVQLLTRHWMITDAQGHVHEVRGDGVVGKQPVLRPGETFEYASGTPLATPSGIMMGSYQMQAADTGEQFDITIPAFSLDSPHNRVVVN